MGQKLEVPENISLRYELWRGFGVPELIRTALCSVIVTIVVTVLAALLTAWHIGIVIVGGLLLFLVFFAGIFSKFDNNQSIYDYIMQYIRFMKSQQSYFYKKEQEVIYLAEEDAT